MEDSNLFEIATNVSTPLALAGLIVAVFFLILKIIVSNNIFVALNKESTKHLLMYIINRIFILAICAMLLGFIGYIYSQQVNRDPNPLKNNITKVEGTVFFNNKELENVSIKILEAEKSAVTNIYGKFNIEILSLDTIKELTLAFSHPSAADTQMVFSGVNTFKGLKVYLDPKKRLVIGPATIYTILSGRVVDVNGNPIPNVVISTIENSLKTASNTTGLFKLESRKKMKKSEILFLFTKNGYVPKEEYFYINTTDLRVVLNEKD